MWFNIIKVDDIDFDNAIEAFGQYSASAKDPEDLFPMIMEAALEGKSKLNYKDIMDEKIRINPQMCHDYLVHKLGIPPSDKQLISYITRVIMHEATHAGMGDEQMNMTDAQAEFGAYTGQFPDSQYLALKRYLLHPATKTQFLPPELQEILGISATMENPPVEKVREMINFIDGITSDLPENQETYDLKDKITNLEMLARKGTKGELIGDINFQDPKIMADRWGTDAFNEVKDALEESYIGEDKEKMVGAVTSTTAGMESRPRYSSKKEDEE
tara:strand:+ start:295 stop:1110 length:816 start_codon:yes stop_codon:yes gene_type:complete